MNLDDDFVGCEKACEQIRKENILGSDDFALMLGRQKLAPRRISTHRDNVDFFIDEFLLFYRTVLKVASDHANAL